ncbi:MAG: sensor histidine kinase, partial [Solirubrobacteraceae bacterium]
GDGAQPALQDALADALGDPSLALAFWLKDPGGYVDATGRELHMPAAGGDRAAVEVELGGERVGAIVYDATLIAAPGLVRAAGRIVALALERERLTAALRASRERLRASRARIARAADEERRRIARDLHDGLQTRLVVLAIKAHSVSRQATPAAAPEADALHAGLQTAISELRELVQGVMPAALTERGLCGAVQDLADTMPIPTRLELDGELARLPGPAESAGYLLVSEAFTNAVKHSRARELRLRLASANGRLRIEIADDGIGGARHGDGSGLRGLADRIEALDGSVRVESPPGGGTLVIAEMPCAS